MGYWKYIFKCSSSKVLYFRINNSSKALLYASLLSIGIPTRIEQTLSVGGETIFGSHLSVAKNDIVK